MRGHRWRCERPRRRGRVTGPRMLSLRLAVHVAVARLDRPGLVQYRTTTEYSASHRPATRASEQRPRQTLLCCVPRPHRSTLHASRLIDTRPRRNVARISRNSNVHLARRPATEWRRGAGRATRAQLSRRLPLRALLVPPSPFIVLGSGS